MVSDLNMSHRKMSDFVSFPLFGFTLAITTEKFRMISVALIFSSASSHIMVKKSVKDMVWTLEMLQRDRDKWKTIEWRDLIS